ncbi:hypothetical protein [Nocardioides currus]|uniref:DUF4367 domain-containing protein n=1 Tax=Nocardioides currus TaxID=2133958 RepID=A0A2R7YS33_9ACTN|nr:hypothetical protein [Nocardioides currus]PUA79044.1 hypothetical protein C7S10_21465 [Nocardioides currus]
MSDALEARLRELGRDVRVEVPRDLEAAVMTRVRAAPVPSVGRRTRLRRWVAGAFLGLLGVGVVASPVGASVLDWFGFHGVVVVGGQPRATDEPTVPGEPAGLGLDAAADLAGFTPVVPALLGDPDGVAVSADGEIVSLSWGSGEDTVRLDEFRGSIDPMFLKSVDQSRIVTIDAGVALWLATPHDVGVVTDDGSTRRLDARLAAPTLVWTQGDLTLRLEGDRTLEQAVAIAESAR